MTFSTSPKECSSLSRPQRAKGRRLYARRFNLVESGASEAEEREREGEREIGQTMFLLAWLLYGPRSRYSRVGVRPPVHTGEAGYISIYTHIRKRGKKEPPPPRVKFRRLRNPRWDRARGFAQVADTIN